MEAATILWIGPGDQDFDTSDFSTENQHPFTVCFYPQIQLNVLRWAELQIAFHLKLMGAVRFALLRSLGLRGNIELHLNFAAQFLDVLEL